MTQPPKRKSRAATDEGAPYTAAVMAEVKRLRLGKIPTWSAERLAAEMTAAGVPWTRDTVVNLENGRRKRIAAHELLALAWVLDVASPVDLLAPGDGSLQVTPTQRVAAETVRAWFAGETGPLRKSENVIKAGQEIGEMLRDAAEELLRRGYTGEQVQAMLSELAAKGAADGQD